jgi:hypothetical protein
MKATHLITDVHRTTFMPYYHGIKFKYKSDCISLLGFTDCSNFLRKRFISKEQFELLVKYNSEYDCSSTNTVGEPADFDKEYLIRYNAGLLQLILGKEFKLVPVRFRSKIVNEQIFTQKRINNN